MALVKLSITLPQDLNDKVELVMQANRINRSAAISMMLSRVNLKDCLPPGYVLPVKGQEKAPD